MFLNGVVQEFSNTVFLTHLFLDGKSRLFVNEDNSLFEVDKYGKKTIFFSIEEECKVVLTDDGLWVLSEKIEGQSVCKFHDIFEKGRKPYIISKPKGSTFFSDEYCFVQFRGKKRKKQLSMVRYCDGNSISINIDRYYKLVSNDEYLFANTSSGVLDCFDLNLEKIWSSTVAKEAWSNMEPHIYRNLIVLNRGANEIINKPGVDNTLAKKEGLVTAHEKDSGNEKWHFIFPEGEANIRLIGDKIYAAQGARIYVLDAGTGDCLVNEPTGFEKFHTGDTLWTDGKYLFYTNFREAIVCLFSLDGKTLLQQLTIPDPYVPYEDVTFEEHYGKYYLPLATKGMALSGVVYGLLCLEAVQEGQGPVITIEERPLTKVLTLTNDAGEEYYHVIVIAETLDDVLRYGSITLKEYAQVRGAIIWEDGKRNKNFNGVIHFSTQLEKYGDGAEQRLQKMIEEVNYFADYMNISAGNAKDDIQVSLVPLPDEF